MANRTTLNSTDCYGRSYCRTRHYLSLQTTSHKLLVVKTRGRDFLCFFLFGSNLESWSFPFNFDIARRYGEQADCRNLHYGEQGQVMKLQTSGVLGTSYAIAKLAPKRGVNR